MEKTAEDARNKCEATIFIIASHYVATSEFGMEVERIVHDEE